MSQIQLVRWGCMSTLNIMNWKEPFELEKKQIPKAIVILLKPFYQHLGSKELLKKWRVYPKSKWLFTLNCLYTLSQGTIPREVGC